MKRFVWRLQRILDLKEKEEQIKSQELFAITETLAQKRGHLLAQQRKLRSIIEEIANSDRPNRIQRQQFFLRHSKTTDDIIAGLKNEIGKLQEMQSHKREEVMKVRRFKEGLQKLRRRAKERFIERQERLEQRQFDEMASIAFSRRRLQVPSHD
jgi:flagellar export protein FliJ